MGRLEGRVAIVTGAGRGLGRAHALHLASEGAAVVVNDLGGDVHGGGADLTPAQEVAREIAKNGGTAVVSGHDVSSWDEAEAMVRLAVESFGDLHVLVNNAGILRDRTLANMSEDDWDSVIRVHLKGHAAPSRHAMAYWRDSAKAGEAVSASVVHTSSVAGFTGNFGQANYSSAKSAVLGLSAVIALEGARYGIRSNAVSPSGRTRIALETPGAEESLKPPEIGFDRVDPANVSPLIGWLAEAGCTATGQVFHVSGGNVLVVTMPQVAYIVGPGDRRPTQAELDEVLRDKLLVPSPIDAFFPRA